tara:strand:+ start:833 stop:1099 length:267 start_codon:yes stop_codon:yes gene_type:complete
MNEYYKIFAWAECPYCINAKDLLTKSGKQFMLCCVDESPELLSYIKDKHNWMTVPMIIRFKRDGPCEWNEEFIGGYSDLVKYLEKEDD